MAGVPPYLKLLDQKDPQFAEQIMGVLGLVDAEGALDAKVKVLMSMLGDAILGHPEGVAALAARARQLGAGEQEIAETVHIAFTAGGIPALVTALRAFK
jgi:alkylhydroperoxidase/carboxymuconolactone decarboxylase family protein YurZ